MELTQVQPKRIVLSVVAIFLLCGCGDSGPFEYSPTSGKVSYEDGSLIIASSVRLSFTAIDRGDDVKVRPRPANTSLNVTDGTFDSVTSYKYGDGLIPGKHRVAIVALDEKGRIVKDAVPAEYTNTARSPLIVDTADAPFDIKIPKP